MNIRLGTPPPPDNDRVCDHNAMLAFPQEKISHYTTARSKEIQLVFLLLFKLTCALRLLYNAEMLAFRESGFSRRYNAIVK